MNSSIDKLHALLESKGKIAVALSGGLDSTILLAYAASILGKENCLALTAKTPYMMEQETKESSEFCNSIGVKQIILELPIPTNIEDNPPNRCYLCKHALFSRLRTEAKAEGFNYIADGTNLDDLGDFRPGIKALKELRISSPLKEAGLGKAAIRMLGSRLGFDPAIIAKPSYACLLTRLEHGVHVDNSILRRIDEAESYLRSYGINACRVRIHGALARIEIPASEWKIILSTDAPARICDQFSRLGFDPITLDLAGYKQGSMNLTPTS